MLKNKTKALIKLDRHFISFEQYTNNWSEIFEDREICNEAYECMVIPKC